MNWIKTADVTPGKPNKDIKPGTTDTSIGEEFKEGEDSKVPSAGAPEGDQKQPATGVKDSPEVHKDEKQPLPPGPKGDQSDVKMDTHTEKPMDVKHENPGKISDKDASKGIQWMKKTAESTPGTENKDIKPGTKDEKVGEDYKLEDSTKVPSSGNPSGEQKQPTEGKDESIGEEYKDKGDQTLPKGPKGDQGEIKQETHESDVSGEEYKEEGPTDLPPANASLSKTAGWLKKPVETDLKLPEKYATFDKIADDYSMLMGFYANALGEDNIDKPLFGRALAHMSLREADEISRTIERSVRSIHAAIQRVSDMEKNAWKSVAGGYLKFEEGMHIVAKTKEEAAKLDSCVESKMHDPDFKPKAGRTKKQSAYAICTKSVLGSSASESSETLKKEASEGSKTETKELDKKSSNEDPLVKEIVSSLINRAKSDQKFFGILKANEEKSGSYTQIANAFLEKVKEARNHKIDFIKLAHYSIECPTCFDAISDSLKRGLVPTDFASK
jgi:hypothetical protein